MGVEPYNFVSALTCVLAQRLVRRICDHCKRPVEYSDEELLNAGLNPEECRKIQFYKGDGCLECHGTGYQGREAILELLELSDTIRQMILDMKSSAEIKRQAKSEGMVFLREAAIKRAYQGVTTLYEINKVTFVE
jgi:type IV pilus assembly protein PilB